METLNERKGLDLLERIAVALEKIVDQHLVGFTQDELDKLTDVSDYGNESSCSCPHCPNK